MLERREPERFGDLLRQHRVAAGLTQEELAERAGVSVRNVQVLERGGTHPHKDTAERLAGALGLGGEGHEGFMAAARGAPHPSGADRSGPRALPPSGWAAGPFLLTGDDLGDGPRRMASPAYNLPLPANSFIGRERELAEVERLLATARVLTLTGAGGCGKTRLALQVAARLQPTFADGAWLAELGPLAEATLVPQAVASALRVREQRGRTPLESLLDALRTRELLLVLDNCEHLVGAAAHLADAVVRACPRVAVLATSREALRIAAEIPYRVPSLAVPDLARLPPLDELGRCEAVQLFCERARMVQPHFALSDQNARAVAEICCRLDGIPLAIELAAARRRMLTTEQIARRLDDRFRLLVGGERTAPSRQQTLRGLIDWSYELLSDQERRLLARLAVFAGGFTLEAAEAVCAGDGIEEAEILDVLTQLVDRSLVVCEEVGSAPRYHLLETIREYAGQRLAESGGRETFQRRHYEWYLALAEESDDAATAELDSWINLLAVEEDNFRAALASSVGGETLAGARLVGSLWRYWDVRGFLSDGARWLEGTPSRGTGIRDAGDALQEAATNALAQGHLVETQSLARALMALAWLAHFRGDSRTARARFEAALATFRSIRDGWGIQWMLVRLAFLLLGEGDVARARALVEETRTLAKASGNRSDLSWALNRLSIVAQYEGEVPRARALLEESLEVLGPSGDRWMIAWSRGDLGNLATIESDYARAQALLEDSLAALREVGRKDGIYWRLLQLGHLARCQGDTGRARAFLDSSLSIAREIDGKLEIGLSLEGLALLSTAAERKLAATLLATESLRTLVESGQVPAITHCLWLLGIQAVEAGAAADGVCLIAATTDRPTFGTLIYPPERAAAVGALAAARVTLGEDGFAKQWAAGQAMTLDQAVAHALSVWGS